MSEIVKNNKRRDKEPVDDYLNRVLFEPDFYTQDTMETVQKEILQYGKEEFNLGEARGITMYAHWKNGVQYVGTCGTTLKHALEALENQNER